MIVVQPVDQIEVFVNESGTITIRQTGMNDEGLVVLGASHVRAVCKALMACAKDAMALEESD